MNSDDMAHAVVDNVKSQLLSRLIQFASPAVLGLIVYLGSQYLNTIQAKQEVAVSTNAVTRGLVDDARVRIAVVESNQAIAAAERQRNDAAINTKLDKLLDTTFKLAEDVAGLKSARGRP